VPRKTEAELEWVRPPRQARSQETLDRILDAAEAMLEEKGWGDLGVSEIAARAGSSVGAFYARFPDKQALLHALHERFVAEAVATADAAFQPARWAGATAPEIVARIVAFLVQIQRDRRGLLRALKLASATDATFRAREHRLLLYVRDGLAALLVGRPEITHPEPERAVAFGLWQVLASLEHALLVPEESAALRRVPERAFPAELTRALLAYLGVREAGAPIRKGVKK
jgi:AcrR family transcriptional regulator